MRYFIIIFILFLLPAFSLAEGLDANTQTLLHLNSDFSDSSANNYTFTKHANPVIDNATYKFGGGSIYFPAASDWLQDSSGYNLGTQDFTIDFWLNLHGCSTNQRIIYWTDNTTWGSYIYVKSDGHIVYVNAAGAEVISFNCPSLDIWHHYALVRNSGVISLYLDGYSKGTSANTYNFNGTYWFISSDGGGVGGLIHSYLDEIRISNVSRWTTNFTPPTCEYDSDGACPAPVVAGFTLLDFSFIILGAFTLAIAIPLGADKISKSFKLSNYGFRKFFRQL